MNGYIATKGQGEFEHVFGGSETNSQTCRICGGISHVIMTFDLMDPIFNQLQTKLSKLPLVCCINCSANSDIQTYKVEDNRITELTQRVADSWVLDPEDRLPSPLPALPMILSPLPPEEMHVPNMNDDELDLIFDSFGSKYICRIFGGDLSYDPAPSCPSCHKEMLYFASITEDATEGELIPVIKFLLGEVILTFHFCQKCGIIHVNLLQ